jgi:hypothetical protein
MQTIWFTVNYLAERARSRVRGMVHSEAGALTLEWIIIAVALVAAGAIAAGLFNAAIRTEARKLP